jgi:hypothetical protein
MAGFFSLTIRMVCKLQCCGSVRFDAGPDPDRDLYPAPDRDLYPAPDPALNLNFKCT